LRLAGAATVEAANAVLERFVPDYNQRFSVAPRENQSDFRPLSKRRNWDRVFSLRYERVVGKDHVAQIGSHWIQLPARPGLHAGLRPAASAQSKTQTTADLRARGQRGAGGAALKAKSAQQENKRKSTKGNRRGAVGMWKSRSDFQARWKGWKTAPAVFEAFHGASLPPLARLTEFRCS